MRRACMARQFCDRTITAFRYSVIDLWRRLLKRRQKDRTTWERMTKIADS